LFVTASLFTVRKILACCFLRLEWSICPLIVGAGHSQPSRGFPAASQRHSRTARTLGVNGSARRAAALSSLHLVFCFPSLAQEARWHELNVQVIQFYQQSKYAEAIPLAQEALRVSEATFGPKHPNVATSLDNLAQLYREQGRYAEAEPLFKRRILGGVSALQVVLVFQSEELS